MIKVRQTPTFLEWLRGLKDIQAAERIGQRIIRVESGLLGDAKFFSGIGELRIDHGLGYRLYFVMRGEALVILLCGGDKGTQKRDIKRAMEIAKEI